MSNSSYNIKGKFEDAEQLYFNIIQFVTSVVYSQQSRKENQSKKARAKRTIQKKRGSEIEERFVEKRESDETYITIVLSCSTNIITY